MTVVAHPHRDADPTHLGEISNLSTHRVAVLVVALMAAIPLATGRVAWAVPGAEGDWNQRVTVAPFDVVLVALAAWVAVRPATLAPLFGSRAVRILAGLYAGCFAVSFLASSSWLGMALGARLAAGVAVTAAAGVALGSPSGRRVVLAGVTAVGVLQAVLAMVQSALGRALDVAPLDFAGPLYPFGSSFAGRGGLGHPYHLAVLLVVAQGAALLGLRAAGRRWPWAGALVVLGAGLSVTYTRAGLLGQVALVAVALVARRPERRTLWLGAGAAVLGLALGGVAFGDGWVARGGQSIDVESADSDRGDRFAEAGRLVADDPLTGTGPGRYVEALAGVEHTDRLPAHNLVLHQAAELGVAGGAVTAALLLLLLARTVRGGVWAGAVVVPLVPFLLLDAYPYVFATGLALTALWLALVRHALRPVPEPVPPAAIVTPAG